MYVCMYYMYVRKRTFVCMYVCMYVRMYILRYVYRRVHAIMYKTDQNKYNYNNIAKHIIYEKSYISYKSNKK